MEHARRDRRAEHRARAILVRALLALHLVVFVLGGAFVARAPAHVLVPQAVVSALAGGGDGASVVASSDGRLERATRPRGERGERGAGPPPLDFFLLPSTLSIAPAPLAGSLGIPSASSTHRLLPSVVHGPRGPPHAC